MRPTDRADALHLIKFGVVRRLRNRAAREPPQTQREESHQMEVRVCAMGEARGVCVGRGEGGG